MSQLTHDVGMPTRSRKHETRKLLAAALALALGTLGGGAQAATQLVTNCNDSGSGSLRAAITAAMSGDVVDARGLTCSTISLTTGALAVTVNDLTVAGAGSSRLTVGNGSKYGRVFRHDGNGVLNLKGMTISKGKVSPIASEPGTRGGCIYSKGTVNLGNAFDETDRNSGVVVSDCSAVSTRLGIDARGGAIFALHVGLANSTVTRGQAIAQDSATASRGGGVYSTSTMWMVNSVVSGNKAVGPESTGGGLMGENLSMRYSEVRDNTARQVGGILTVGSTILIESSTISGNTSTNPSSYAKYTGGAYIAGDNVRLIQTTISNNASSAVGGVQINDTTGHPGVFSIIGSTITGNTSSSASVGAGLRVKGSDPLRSITIESSLISANYSAGHVPSDLDLGFNSLAGSHNLFGAHNGLVPGDTLISFDPKLTPLANNGGVTRTHLLLAGSPAIDAGSNSLQKASDQRGPGFPRMRGTRADIGATEFDTDRIFSNGFE